MKAITGEAVKTKFFRTLKEIRYAGYLTTHPAKGFWEIKQEGEGSLLTSLLILAGTIFVLILKELYTGYIFGGERDVSYFFGDTIVSTSLLFFGWCIANWCLTCLFDGEGKFRDIVKATGYALLPYLIIQLIMIFLSNYFIIREEIFYNMLDSVSIAWMTVLIIMSVMITHQYGVLKAFFVCIASIAALMMITYLILLFFNLMSQVINFVTVYMDEWALRMAGG